MLRAVSGARRQSDMVEIGEREAEAPLRAIRARERVAGVSRWGEKRPLGEHCLYSILKRKGIVWRE